MNKIVDLTRYLTKPLDNIHGVAGFSDWKFYLIFILYSTSFVVFVRDPFFRLSGDVVFQQGIVTLLLAVVLLNTLYWDFQLFGKPSGANLLLQVFSYLPGGMLIARLFGEATQPERIALAKRLWNQIINTTDQIIPLSTFSLPPWLTDLVCNWKISIAFIMLLVLLSLNIRKQIKIGAIFVFLLLPFLTVIANDTEIGFLVLGTLLFVAGLSFQFCRYDRVIYYEQIDAALRQTSCVDSLLLSSVMRIMTRLYQDSKLSDLDVREIVAEEYKTARNSENGYSDMEINQIATGVTRKMIHSYNLVFISQSNSGALMYPNRRLFVCDSILHGIAVWPRVIATLLFAIVWIVSPIDILPDAIPFIGTLDDMFAGITTTLMITSAVQQERTNI